MVKCKKLSEIQKSLKCSQIIDVLNATEKEWPACTCCDLEERNATYGCVDCGRKFCKACFEQEKCISSHSVGKFDDVGTLSCMTHDLELRYLCEDCDVYICLECFIGDHNIHTVKDTASIGKYLLI